MVFWQTLIFLLFRKNKIHTYIQTYTHTENQTVISCKLLMLCLIFCSLLDSQLSGSLFWQNTASYWLKPAKKFKILSKTYLEMFSSYVHLFTKFGIFGVLGILKLLGDSELVFKNILWFFLKMYIAIIRFFPLNSLSFF